MYAQDGSLNEERSVRPETNMSIWPRVIISWAAIARSKILWFISTDITAGLSALPCSYTIISLAQRGGLYTYRVYTAIRTHRTSPDRQAPPPFRIRHYRIGDPCYASCYSQSPVLRGRLPIDASIVLAWGLPEPQQSKFRIAPGFRPHVYGCTQAVQNVYTSI